MVGEHRLKEHKVAIYTDAWGVKKLLSHILRNLRNDRIPRVLWLTKMLRYIFVSNASFCYLLRLPFEPSSNPLSLGPILSQSGHRVRSSLVSRKLAFVGRSRH